MVLGDWPKSSVGAFSRRARRPWVAGRQLGPGAPDERAVDWRLRGILLSPELPYEATVMPICPGCDRPVSYEDLDDHVGSCTEIWSDRQRRNRLVERLERRVEALENELDGLQQSGEDLTSRITRIERLRRSKGVKRSFTGEQELGEQ